MLAIAFCLAIRYNVIEMTNERLTAQEGAISVARENSQKIKLLKLLELLRQETDEQHPMLASNLCLRLSAMDISCDRRTLTKDIATLNEYGYEVMSRLIGHEKAYYVEDRSFSVPEIKILMDAVQAARFITPKKTEILIEKIADLGGSCRAEILKSNMVCFNTQKHTNETIYYSIHYLETAIETQRKVIFQYFDLNERGEKVYRRDGHHYVVEPIALVFNEDNYYLLCYSAKHDGVASYRVDRMTSVEVVEDKICKKALALRNKANDYTEQAFKMYAGQPVGITIEFSDKLIGVIYDKFGEDVKMVRVAENRYTANVRVQLSPTFWGWVFQFGGQMRIVYPEAVVDEYKKQIEQLNAQLEKPEVR